jgi:L-sorbose 1-phosphate reductase
MAQYFEEGFDDIIVLVPIVPVIADAATHAAPKGVINVFAGINKGTTVDLDLSDVYQKQVRMIGHSGSSMLDMHITLEKASTRELSRNRSVAAIGSLSAAREGLMAVKNTIYPGKVVIYPHIKELPLTAVPDLKDILPTVYEKLADGREWTNEAEEELLRQMLPYIQESGSDECSRGNVRGRQCRARLSGAVILRIWPGSRVCRYRR